jgi:hypothetical protein
MRTTAVLVFGLLAAGCGSNHRTPTAIGNAGNYAAPSLAGVYDCNIGDTNDHYEYAFFRCVIAQQDGKLILDKQGGSQRFRGVISPDGAGGFAFNGRFYCPFGDCEQPLIGSFARVHPAAAVAAPEYRGAFVNSTVLVRLRWRSASDGAGLGGDGYGGVTYGAASDEDTWGGATYGSGQGDVLGEDW